jgi:hypothetical protein
MSDAGNVLPQAEIDALFKQATGRSLSAPPEIEAAKLVAVQEKPVPQPVKSTPVEKTVTRTESSSARPISSTQLDNAVLKKIQTTLDDLIKRIENLESDLGKLNQTEKKTPDLAGSVNMLAKKLESEVGNIQKINGRVEKIIRESTGTPGYGIREKFTCSKCGSHGYLVIPARCSCCGTEGWLGWWPKKG